jgi:hypothetical protein
VGATRQRLPAQPKILKKIIGIPNLPIKTNIFSKKVCLVPQKCKGAKNSCGGYATEFAGSTQNPKKIIGIPNLPIKTNIFSKKVCLVPQKCKGAKNSYGDYTTEFAGSTQNPKKNYRNTKSTDQNENFHKKSMFSILKV